MKRASLNHVYRVIWSHVHNAYIAVAENAGARGKKSGKAVTLIATALLTGAATAGAIAADLPAGGQIVAGTGSIGQSGAAMTVTQTSDRMAADWQSFSIGQGHSVNFVQPSASAVALNRVLGSDVSVIQGALTANGHIFLVNPNGVLFTPTAQVDVGGLVASTLNIGTADFMAGNYQFAGNSTAAITQQGNISTATGGTVALIAAKIVNEGSIAAPQGNVLIGAGQAVTLDLGGPVKLQVTQGALDALIEQGGAIRADGGMIYLSAQAAGDLAAAVINHTGISEARSLSANDKGEIVLIGDMAHGTVNVGGTLDASAPNGGNGGFVETSAAHVQVADSARITTAAPHGSAGVWLIDPQDFTIAAAGGDITGTALSANLGGGNVIIQSTTGATAGNGDIFVNDAVNWSANQLTLNALRNIQINANLNGSGTASLALEYGQGAPNAGNAASYSLGNGAKVNLSAGNTFSTKLGLDGAVVNYSVITGLGAEGSTTTTDLQGMSGNLAGNYVLGADIDATATSAWNSNGAATPVYAGFMPVGDATTGFTGHFHGLGHTISNLAINRPAANHVGLFGYVGLLANSPASVIRDVGLLGGSVSGANYVGGLAGQNYQDTISNVWVSGSVTGGDHVGGLVGRSDGIYSAISNAWASGSVSGASDVGGLVGRSVGTIGNAHATGSVSGTTYVGGLIGESFSAISNAYATGNVSGTNYIGGLVGGNWVSIASSNATGNVTGADAVGGLVGYNGRAKTISDAWASGGVFASAQRVGGLVGWNNQGAISNAYATGSVSGASYVGGLVGYNSGTVSNTFWDAGATGQANAIGFDSNAQTATALNGAGGAINAYTQATYTGFDFTNTWWMIDGNTRPFLRSEYSTTITNAHQLQLMTINPAASYSLSRDIDMSETGRAGGMWASTGFMPIGDLATQFTGSFDGQNHSISNLTINRPGSSYVGLFGIAHGAGISNVDITGANITGRTWVGSLLGWNDSSGISNAHVSGSVTAQDEAGALVGYNDSGSIGNSSASGTVSGDPTRDYLGGLVGRNLGAISDSWASVNVSGGRYYLGGLVGSNTFTGSITRSYATGSVSGADTVGGLAGLNESAISISYASGNVSAASGSAGGLVGWNNNGSIQNTYATGSVSALTNAGGLVGYNGGTGSSSIANSYATGRVTGGGTGSVNGLVGVNDGTVTASYWDMTSSGRNTGCGGSSTGCQGFNAADMKALTNYVLWNIDDAGGTGTVWRIYNGDTTPLLRAFLTPLTVTSVTGGSKIYDGIAVNSQPVYTVSGSHDASKIIAGGSVQGNKDANSYAIGIASTQQGYDLIGTRLAAYDITQRVLNLTGSRPYDGTTGMDAGFFTLGNLVAGEALTLSGTQTGLDPNVSAGIQSLGAIGIALGNGADGAGLANNYTLIGGTHSAQITAKALTISGSSASDKVYDGTTAVSVTAGTLAGLIGGETLNISANGSFADQNAGTNKTVAASYVLSNGSGRVSNYSSLAGENLSAAITPKALTISGSSAADKVYDGTTAATVTAGTLAGLIGGETLNIAASGSFADQNAGTNKTVAASYVLSNGSGRASNYSSLAGENLSAGITPKALAISGSSAADKVYDGTTAASVTAGTLAGVIGGETLNIAASGSFADQNAGTNKTVAASYVLSNGSGRASNYSSLAGENLSAAITPKALTISGSSAADKVYDGTTAATVTAGTLAGLIGGETLNIAASGSFADQNAGTNKTVAASYVLSNGSGRVSNYSSLAGENLSAAITPKALAISGSSAGDKVYDGTTVATVTPGALAGMVGSETLGVSGSGMFNSKDVLNAATVVTTYTLSDGSNGGLAVNYSLAGENLSAAITPKALAISGSSAGDKVYDGTTVASVTAGKLAGLIGGETLNIAASGSFADKNAGTNKTVAASYVLSNGSGRVSNYSSLAGENLSAAITPKALTISGSSAADKVYDGTTAASVTAGSLAGLIGGETLNIAANGSFADQNAGTNKTVAASYVLSNGSGRASNYSLAGENLAANITARPVTIAAVGGSDASTSATQASAIQTVQQVASSTNSSSTATMNTGGRALAGGSDFLEVPDGEALGADGNGTGGFLLVSTDSAGRDPSGTIGVRVVNGGINDSAEQNRR